MSQKVKTPKSVIITLVAGFGLGAITMAGIQSGGLVSEAFAKDDPSLGRTASGSTSENIAALRNLDESFANLAEFVAPAVVDIRATTGRAMGPNGERVPIRAGEGSGFIFRPDGYIITNDHVVAGADKVRVTLKDGKQYEGTVLRAHDSDIAVVKIDAKGLPTLSFADSSKLRPGSMCMAVGAPFGLTNSVTFGHVSAVGRDTPIGQGMDERYYPDLIQTDASINMGNSGGPLVNVDGQVIGVNTAIFSPNGTSAGIGFAIPSNQARFIADILIEKGKVTRAMMGLIPENLKEFEKREKNLSGGAKVTRVQPDSPAAKAGLKEGDVIVRIGSTPIHSQLDLRNAMLIYAPDTTVDVEYLRGGKKQSTKVKLEEFKRPEVPQPQIRRQAPNGLYRFPEGFDKFDQDLFDEFRKRFEGDSRTFGEEDQNEPPIRVGQARLGVEVGNITPELRSKYSIPADVKGAVVLSVEPGSVAARFGLKPGDVILRLGEKDVTDTESLAQAMKDVQWNQSHRIKFGRYGDNATLVQDVMVLFK